jgi:hypothetical protein
VSERAFLGVDIGLAADGDFAFEPDGSLSVVEGWECLKQDLADRLNCSPGGVLWHPEFGGGLQDSVGSMLGDAELLDFAAAARQEVLKDARVGDVVASAWRDADDPLKVWLRLEVTTASGQEAGNAVFPFGGVA